RRRPRSSSREWTSPPVNLRNEPNRRQFRFVLGAIVAVAAVIRVAYAVTVKGLAADGFYYHLAALRFADGDAYTSPFGDVGAPIAHHPPGWETLLGIVSWLGARSLRDHRLVGVVIGLGIVVLAGLVGRRYFNARVGLIAALLAALYPGFWLLEGNVLSEPLGLFVLGIFLLVVADLRDRPTVLRSVAIGALSGALALVRSEQLLLLFIVVAPVLLLARTLSMRKRLLCVLVAGLACGAVLAPWTIYNATRFRDPVLLSTNDGGLLLIGNCPPSTYTGRYL